MGSYIIYFFTQYYRICSWKLIVYVFLSNFCIFTKTKKKKNLNFLTQQSNIITHYKTTRNDQIIKNQIDLKILNIFEHQKYPSKIYRNCSELQSNENQKSKMSTWLEDDLYAKPR